jgi:hypothetical protein
MTTGLWSKRKIWIAASVAPETVAHVRSLATHHRIDGRSLISEIIPQLIPRLAQRRGERLADADQEPALESALRGVFPIISCPRSTSAASLRADRETSKPEHDGRPIFPSPQPTGAREPDFANPANQRRVGPGAIDCPEPCARPQPPARVVHQRTISRRASRLQNG